MLTGAYRDAVFGGSLGSDVPVTKVHTAVRITGIVTSSPAYHHILMLTDKGVYLMRIRTITMPGISPFDPRGV